MEQLCNRIGLKVLALAMMKISSLKATELLVMFEKYTWRAEQ